MCTTSTFKASCTQPPWTNHHCVVTFPHTTTLSLHVPPPPSSLLQLDPCNLNLSQTTFFPNLCSPQRFGIKLCFPKAFSLWPLIPLTLSLKPNPKCGWTLIQLPLTFIQSLVDSSLRVQDVKRRCCSLHDSHVHHNMNHLPYQFQSWTLRIEWVFLLLSQAHRCLKSSNSNGWNGSLWSLSHNTWTNEMLWLKILFCSIEKSSLMRCTRFGNKT